MFAESSSSEEEGDLTESGKLTAKLVFKLYLLLNNHSSILGKELKALMHKQIQDSSIDDEEETEKDNTSIDSSEPTSMSQLQ